VLHAAGASDQGPVRTTNEDRFRIDEALGLCVIADGLGGHNAGEVAARLAVDAVVEHLRRAAGRTPAAHAARDPALHPFGIDPALSERGNVIRTAILLADVQVVESAVSTERYAGMGTTIVVAQAIDQRLIVGYVGDSRLYVLSRGALRQVTSDDSWIAAMLNDPDADPAVLRHHPMRHALTNVVGGRARTDVHVVESPVASGDRILLTTDGVHGVLDETKLTKLLAGDNPKAAAQAIVAAALKARTQDNATAIVAKYE
jgi:PPM family protein phosphatase